ncbi:MAG TPA: UbiA family prenyltransferase [Gemmatimonadaceae bacterium]|nr:UbiA family prenyltransferase [Gemmatimonadaceae bacterium]
MPDARALLEVARWRNALIAAVGVYVGAWWAMRDATRPATLAAALAAIALTGYANAFNDLADIAIDRAAHPARPLPSGTLRPRTVRRFAALLAAGGIALAFVARPSLGILTVAVVALMTLYSATLARLPLIGNLTVAVLASLPFFYGAVTAGGARAGLTLLAVAIPLHFARELAKSLDDAHADAPYRRTAPLVLGRPVVFALIAGSVGVFAWRLLSLASPDPRLRMLVIPALALCVVATRRALAGRVGAPLLFKSAMLAAMAAIVIAR